MSREQFVDASQIFELVNQYIKNTVIAILLRALPKEIG